MSPQALFAQATGMNYNEASNIVGAAIVDAARKDEPFDLEALIAKHKAPGAPEKKRKGKTYAPELVGMVAEGKAEAEGRKKGQTFNTPAAIGKDMNFMKGRKADAIPGGGGGPNSAHRKFSDKMEARRAQSASLQDGITYGTSTGPYDGRDSEASGGSGGTSIFDPVLCELAYRWFCPPGGLVYDPFAGGSVRGIVAAKLGRRYFGIDLRPEQIEANRLQAERICRDCAHQPEWVEGDSAEGSWTEERSDFLFSCPPYGDLEVYSDDPRDISTMPYEAFLGALRLAIRNGARLLKDDRFACFVVGDFRDRKTGAYRGFIGDVIQGFEQAGLLLYNEAILVTAAGSLPIRVRKQFESARKLGKTHQNVLVFLKGDPKKASAAIGQVEFGEGDPLETESTEHGERLTSIGEA
jgi:DNA modification methylase